MSTPITQAFQNTPQEIFEKQGLWTWWNQNNGNGTNLFNGVTEKGIDFANAFGTPIGAIQGGTVINVEHHDNSIGDLVVLQGTSGYWLYQHMTSSLKVGDTVATGGIVGTENGLPVDEFSTGPHIEVRYSPTYNKNINSWFEPWINPKDIFALVANTPDNSGIITNTGSTGGGQLINFLNGNNLINPDKPDIPASTPNTFLGFDFTRFIDSGLLFIIGVTLLAVGVWLLVSHSNGTNPTSQASRVVKV